MAEKENLDFLKEQADNLHGFEGIGAETVAIPFLKLAQDLTPQLKKTKPNYIEGLELGQFFNPVTSEVYGTELKIIILGFERIYLEWLPNRGGLVDRHTPENAAAIAYDKTFGKWKTKQGNDLIEYYTYYIIIEGHENEGPMVMSLKSGDIKEAKLLNRLMTTHMMSNGRRAMPYWLVWKLTSSLESKGDNEYYAYRFKFDRYIKEQELQIVDNEREALPEQNVDYAQLSDSHGKVEDDEDYDDSDL